MPYAARYTVARPVDCGSSIDYAFQEPFLRDAVVEQPAECPIGERDVPFIAIPVRPRAIPPGAGRAPRAGGVLDAAPRHPAAIYRDRYGASAIDRDADRNGRTEPPEDR